MLTLNQLISEATALPDADKAILIDKIMESMAEPIDRDILLEGVKKAQERIMNRSASIAFGLIGKWNPNGTIA